MVEIVDVTAEMLGTAEKGLKPDVKVDLPKNMTPELYIRIFRRITASIRHSMYQKIRDHLKSAKKEKELSKEQIAKITAAVNGENTREKVCARYSLEKGKDEKYGFILTRAYYAYLGDKKFCDAAEVEKGYNERLLSAVLKGWLIPEMEKDPSGIDDEELAVCDDFS